MKPKVKKIILLSIVAVACMFLRSDQVNAYTGKVTDENKITWNYTLENDEIVLTEKYPIEIFWQGFATGIAVGAFNQIVHSLANPSFEKIV